MDDRKSECGRNSMEHMHSAISALDIVKPDAKIFCNPPPHPLPSQLWRVATRCSRADMPLNAFESIYDLTSEPFFHSWSWTLCCINQKEFAGSFCLVTETPPRSKAHFDHIGCIALGPERVELFFKNHISPEECPNLVSRKEGDLNAFWCWLKSSNVCVWGVFKKKKRSETQQR